MKNKNKIVLTIALGAFSMLSGELFAQEQNETAKDKVLHSDSTEVASREAIEAQKTKDANTLEDYQHERKETKAKAREAQRVESEANTAARESRYALRSEKRAQKARKEADKQADKASKARVKSDRN